MKDVASNVLGTTKIMTLACFGKYIGEIGLHSKPQIYAEEGFRYTEMYPEEITSFEPPSSQQLDEWIATGRAAGKRALDEELNVRNVNTKPINSLPSGLRTEKYNPTGDIANASPNDITDDDVVWCYRSILGREPESTEIIERHLTVAKDFRALVLRFISSQEYRNKNWSPRLVDLGYPAMDVEVEALPVELSRMSDRVREAWTELGALRPHHSVLSGRNYLPQNITRDSLDRFWASGAREADIIAAILKRHGFQGLGSKTCVEYGCGLGRVTFALAKMFGSVRACDISPTHIAQAQRSASEAKIENVQFRLCSSDLLNERLAPCDFFYSRIVFQHNPPPLIRVLIARAVQSLVEGGIAILQVPTYGSNYSFRIQEYLAREALHDMEMHCIPQHEIFAVVADAQCQLLEVREDNSIGRHGTWISNTFVISRPSAQKVQRVQTSGALGRII